AILLPSAAFTAQHVLFMREWLGPQPLAIAVGGLFAFSLLLQWLYERAESLVAPWLLHALGDVAMMSIAVTLLRAHGGG
ncbi:MAG: CPBP family intramembrane metalloprotease, partial [Gemmatimonadetes bacterium]|nr:CPBP family intramembrane metalloprotease [Gemmatimonadota bacterium]